jgi:broad specificity phosphatase PhoE
LTAEGRRQAEQLIGAVGGIQLVVSSPLRRTLQTALHAFPALERPAVVYEGLREQIGMHQCDRRRATAAIDAEFGKQVDLATLPAADELWSEQRESKDSVADRGAAFTHWLMQLPDHQIAVTTHHHFLLVLFNCVFESAATDVALRKPFAVGEMRSVRLYPVGPPSVARTRRRSPRQLENVLSTTTSLPQVHLTRPSASVGDPRTPTRPLQ